MDLPPESRVKGFGYSFARDFRTTPWHIAVTPITFTYVSSPGKGLAITVV
jgi:hypothetical protein